MKPLSLAARLQIGIVIPTLLLFVVALVLSARSFSEHFYQEERRAMSDLEHKLAAVLRSSGLDGLIPQTIPPSHHVFVYAVFSTDGSQAVFSNNQIARKILAAPIEAPLVVRKFGGEHFLAWSAKEPLPTGVREIRMAINVQSRVDFEHFQVVWFSGLMVTLGTLITVLVTVTVGHGFRNLNRISTDIANVSATNLSVRWLPQQFPEEIAPLLHALNRMLEQIEEDYRYLEQFSDAIAHELKTPLTSQIACLELALMRARSREDYRAALQHALNDSRHLSSIVQDMLFISKARALAFGQPEPLDTVALIRDPLERMQPLLERRRMQPDVRLPETPPKIRGYRLLLDRALANLISNAISHAEPGSPLIIEAVEEQGVVRLSFSNRGNVSETFEEHAFDRFWSGSSARTRTEDATHSGLGLAIVKAAVEACRGRVVAQAHDGWVRFDLYLPAWPRNNLSKNDTGAA